MKKTLLSCATIPAFFLITACGGGGGVSGDLDNQDFASVKTQDDLPTCNARQDGSAQLVEKETAIFACLDANWVKIGDYVSSEKDTSHCSYTREGDLIYVGDVEEYWVCDGDEWVDYSRIKSSFSEDDDVKKAFLKACVAEGSSGVTCYRIWEDFFIDGGAGKSNSSKNADEQDLDHVETVDNLPNCNTRQNLSIRLVDEDESIYFCMNGEWLMIGEYVATKEDMLRCNYNREGFLYYVDDIKEYRTCSNGEWEYFDMESAIASLSDDKKCDDDDWGDCDDYGGISSSSKKSAFSSSSAMLVLSSQSQSGFPEGIKPSGYYNCSIYKCAPVDDLNQDMLEKGEYGEFYDDRNGVVYKVIKYKTKIWMAQNLNYEVNDGIQSWCYNNETDSCAKYGRLYTWAAAIGKLESECGNGYSCTLLTGEIQGVCPSGWHLSTGNEWASLTNSNINLSELPGPTLKSQTGWMDDGNGDDIYGFAALPSGSYFSFYLNYEENPFVDLGFHAYFWEYNGGSAYENDALGMCIKLSYNSDKSFSNWCSKTDGYSVRCVMD